MHLRERIRDTQIARMGDTMSKYKLNGKAQKKMQEKKKYQNKLQQKRYKKAFRIQSLKEDLSFYLICIGIAAFIIVCIVFYVYDLINLQNRQVPMEDYSLSEMDTVFEEADVVQYTCYSDYWDCPFTIVADQKGIGTMTIPLFREVNITNKAEEEFCTRKEVEIELPGHRGGTYELYRQGKFKSFYMSNLYNGYFYDAEKQLTAYFDAPDWENDRSGMYIYSPEGTPLVRLQCDSTIRTMTFENLTNDYRLTPEQQMCVILYYWVDRRGEYPYEYNKYGDDLGFYNYYD